MQKKQIGVLDYDDLLLAMRDLCRHPEVGPKIAARFESVLVDEYQGHQPIAVGDLDGAASQRFGIDRGG